MCLNPMDGVRAQAMAETHEQTRLLNSGFWILNFDSASSLLLLIISHLPSLSELDFHRSILFHTVGWTARRAPVIFHPFRNLNRPP